MAFEMETSRTADAAKLAVLWRDRDKRQGGAGGSGVPDHFVEDVFEGAILPEVIQPPAGQPTTNPDGTTTPGVVPEPTLVDHKTVYSDAKAPSLVSLFAAVQDLRAVFASPTRPGAPGPTDPLHPLTEDGEQEENPFATAGPFFGPDLQTTLADIRALTHGNGIDFGSGGMGGRVAALRAAEMSVLDVLMDLRAWIFGFFGPALTESVSEWVDGQGLEEHIPGIGSGLLRAVQEIGRRLAAIETQITSRLDGLESRIEKEESASETMLMLYERLQESVNGLSQRVHNLETGTSGQ